MTTRIGRRLAFFLAIGLVLGQADAHAQAAFPTRPITMIVGWPAGGPADNVARVIASQMSSVLGQQIVIDNRPGAGGNIGSELAARSKPDGYTIMLATVASHGWNPALYSNLGYKPVEDFAPVGLINTSPGALLVSANSPGRSAILSTQPGSSRGSSTTALAASARHSTWRLLCSRSWPASRSPTFRSKAPRQP